MKPQENVSLREFNTFHIDASARYYAAFGDLEQLKEALETAAGKPLFILGGGSNILFTRDVDGLLLHNAIKGIEIVEDTGGEVILKAGAGEVWHQFVMYCVGQGLGGIENLSLIPGSVGASPMQNIGAYGVELKDVFHSLRAYDLKEKAVREFNHEDCRFGYRDSVFKNEYRDRFIILNVSFRLQRRPTIHTEYGAIREELARKGITNPTIKDVSNAVIHIRQSKLPDPAVIGNAGSFFKNPSVPAEVFTNLKIQFPSIVGYQNSDGTVKLAAGWLIEQCGWKGHRKGDAGCHAKQALVLVNHGNAKGHEILELSEEIRKSVSDKFGVSLEREVNIY